jgi:hypothetical protein
MIRHFRIDAVRLTAVLAFALFMTGTVAAQVAPPVGPYGFVLNATYDFPFQRGGVAMLGVMNFDGAGNVSGPYALEVGSGGVSPKQSIAGSFTGTYSTNPDGTGTISMALDNGDNLTLIMVIENNSRGLQLAATSWCSGPACHLVPSVVSGVGEAQFNGGPHPIHTGFLIGSYGVQLTKSAPTEGTSLQVVTFDGAGNVTTSGTFVAPGPNVQSGTLTGTYTVNPNGTGTITFPPQPGSLLGQTWAFVITGGHSGLLALQTNRAGDGTLSGLGRLQ